MAVNQAARFQLRLQASLSDRLNIDIPRPSSGKRSILGEII